MVIRLRAVSTEDDVPLRLLIELRRDDRGGAVRNARGDLECTEDGRCNDCPAGDCGMGEERGCGAVEVVGLEEKREESCRPCTDAGR